MNHDSATPLYVQLKEELQAAILGGTYRDGEKLPSERALCERYGVSRITVRQALNELDKTGFVFSAQGKGTFVRTPIINQGLLKITSFAKSLEATGIAGFTKIHSFGRDVSAPKVEEIIYGTGKGKLCQLGLLGFADREPIVYYSSFLRSEIGEKMHETAARLEARGLAFSTYDLYGEIGVRIERIEQQIVAINADTELSELLRIKPGDALLFLKSMVYIAGGGPAEYKMAYYRSDKYTFTVKREV